MVGRAKSQAEKRTEERRAHDELMSRAVEAYLAELEGVQLRPLEPHRGARRICKDFEDQHFLETGIRIALNDSTLRRRADGHKTRAAANATRAWLTDIEEKVVVDFCIEVGKQGWPPSHRRIKEHVDKIARARLGPEKFPSEGVGKNWTARSEDKHAQGVNPNSNTYYWSLLGETVNKYKITPERTFGSDEVGVQQQGDARERVATGKNKKGPQYQQSGGTRKNTTVIVTICADGTSIPPTVIFKGSAYQVRWGENNPLNASLGYQKKGWTSGEIGAEWIKIFDEETKHKVKPGEYRLLLVDGHNSHYTIDFLLHARERNIIVLCYIPHTTHVYQGLDVVIFSPLKWYINEERRKWLNHCGEVMNKDNFLQIYSPAHVRALTPENIKAAFKKTGVWPFNPNVVTEDMLAPSKPSSIQAHLPVPSDDPAVNTLVMMFRELASIASTEDETESDGEEAEEDDGNSDAATECSGLSKITKEDVIRKAVDGLSQTKLAHLVQTNLITSDHAMPSTSAQPISTHPPSLPNMKAETEREALIFASLRETEHLLQIMINRSIEHQAKAILWESWCGNAKNTMQHQEGKKKGKKKKGMLPAAMPVLVTSDQFYEAVQEAERDRRAEERAKADKKTVKAAFQEAKEKWQKGEEVRKQAKDAAKKQYDKAMTAWQKKKDAVKGTGRGRGRQVVKKPVLADFSGNVPERKPQPKLKDFLNSTGDVDESSTSSDEDDEGGDDDSSDED